MADRFKAPAGKFRVIGVDTFAHEEYPIGDFDTRAEAIAEANRNGGVMHKAHVYDDHGVHIHEAGSF